MGPAALDTLPCWESSWPCSIVIALRCHMRVVSQEVSDYLASYLWLAPGKDGRVMASPKGSPRHAMSKQGLGMSCIGKSTGLVTRVFLDEQRTVEKLRKLRLTLWDAGLVIVSYCSGTMLAGLIGTAFPALQRKIGSGCSHGKSLQILFPDP